MDVSTDVWPVVIVGAGPTGATAAIELGQRGIRCLLVDRWADVYPQPRAVHLDDEVHRALARLGVGARFADISRPSLGMRLVDRRHRVLGQFTRDGVSPTTGYPRATMFDQPDLETLLRGRVREQASVAFRGGVDVTGVDQSAPGLVAVHLTDSATGAKETVHAEVVLGCDGANSMVRTSIGSSLDGLGFEQRWLVVDVATDDDLGHWDGVHQVCDSGRAATYMRIGETRHRWEFRLLDHEAADDFGTLDALEPLLHPWLGAVDRSGLELVRVVDYTFRSAIADRWRSGRVFLLGDAAHLTPPFIGQGMGAGIRDAVNLGWKVAGFLTGALAEDVLDSYQPERFDHARSLIRLATTLGVVMTGGGRAGDAARRAIVPVLNHLPWVRAHVADSTTPALGRSRWVAAGRQDRLAGHLCPNPVLDGRRLDDVVGAGWALVTVAAPSPSDADALRRRSCVVVEAAGELADWLLESGATAALVRPDRTVMGSSADVTVLCASVQQRLAPVPEASSPSRPAVATDVARLPA